MRSHLILIKIARDEEAGVWYVEHSDVPGLRAELVQMQVALQRDPSLGMLRLVDFVSPIRGESGAIVAMIGSHILWAWVVGLIQREQRQARARIALVSADGQVLVGPPGVSASRILTGPLLPVAQRVSKFRTPNSASSAGSACGVSMRPSGSKSSL